MEQVEQLRSIKIRRRSCKIHVCHLCTALHPTTPDRDAPDTNHLQIVSDCLNTLTF